MSISSVDALGRKEGRTLWSPLLSSWLSHFLPVRLCDMKLSLFLSLESSSAPTLGHSADELGRASKLSIAASPTRTLCSVVPLLAAAPQLPKDGPASSEGEPCGTRTAAVLPSSSGPLLIESVFPPPSRPAKGTAGPQSRCLPRSGSSSGSL